MDSKEGTLHWTAKKKHNMDKQGRNVSLDKQSRNVIWTSKEQGKGSLVMTINFDYEVTKEFDFDFEAMERQVIEACLDYEACPYEAEVSLLLTDNEQIRQINQEYRGIDSPTDVLSFPVVEYSTPGDFSKLEEEAGECFHPETGELLLGDIVISLERAQAQAEEYGHSLLRELAFLTTHSMFHLFGYDHMEEKERWLMEEKQNKVLELLQILR